MLRQKREKHSSPDVKGRGNQHAIRCLWEQETAVCGAVKTTGETCQREIASRSADEEPKIMHMGHRWGLQPLRTELVQFMGPNVLVRSSLKTIEISQSRFCWEY